MPETDTILFGRRTYEQFESFWPHVRQDAPWKNSRLVPELDAREVAAMKTQPGKDMIIFGSGSITSLLTEHGLIDEYMFVVSPVLIGDGRSLISGVPKRRPLKLLEAKSFPAGNVMLRYAPRG
jgi:dihydrofolate reductase